MNATIEATHKAPPIKATWICLAIAWVLFLLPIPGAGLFVGWPLNLVAFILAIVVMTRGYTAKGLIPLIASLMFSPIIYFIGVSILVGTATSSYDDYKTRAAAANTQESAVAATAADAIRVSAGDLFRAYAANEIAADSQYKGKPIEITGTVDGISSDLMDEPVVQLSAGQFQSVNANGLEKNVAAGLAKGQSVTLSCTGAGEVIGSPLLDNCSVR
jgi:hypothetical protein